MLTDLRIVATLHCTLLRIQIASVFYVDCSVVDVRSNNTKKNCLQVGVFDAAPETVLQKGRLMPGKMLLVDTQEIQSRPADCKYHVLCNTYIYEVQSYHYSIIFSNKLYTFLVCIHK